MGAGASFKATRLEYHGLTALPQAADIAAGCRYCCRLQAAGKRQKQETKGGDRWALRCLAHGLSDGKTRPC